jgi:hypothetical protein
MILMAYQIILSHAQQTVKVPVKRVHSRHRRFIAPGAIWDIMVGVEVIGGDYELRYNAFVRYRMDYLFGGTAALASVLAQANAAAKAENDVKAQLALFSSGKRKKRSRLVFNPYIYIYHKVTNSSTWQLKAPSSCNKVWLSYEGHKKFT